MRQRVVLVVVAIFLLLLSVVTGCEMLDLDFTLNVDYHTTVKISGDIIQDIRLEITGMTDTMLEEAGFSEGFPLGGEGWDVETESTDDSVIITATGHYILDEDGNISQVEGGPEVPEVLSVRIEGGLLSTKYFAEINVTQSGIGELGEGGEFGELAGIMLGDIFHFSWTITLPGSVVESNADIVEGGSATWVFDFDSLSSGFDMTMQSQYTNWPVIGGIIAGVVVVLVLVVFFIIRRRRAPTPFSGEIAN